MGMTVEDLARIVLSMQAEQRLTNQRIENQLNQVIEAIEAEKQQRV